MYNTFVVASYNLQLKSPSITPIKALYNFNPQRRASWTTIEETEEEMERDPLHASHCRFLSVSLWLTVNIGKSTVLHKK